MLAGDPPKPLRAVLAIPLSDRHQANLMAANKRRDELTVATIHAFCRTVISSYAVDAGIDPGAQMLDAEKAETVYHGVFDRWLKRRLDGTAGEGDPIAVLSRGDPRTIADTLFDLAKCRFDHRAAKPVPANLTGRPDTVLSESVDEFRRWFSSVTPEPDTEALLSDLEEIGNHFGGTFATTPNFPRLWTLAHPPRVRTMYRDAYELKTPRLKGAWKRAAGTEGEELHAEMCRHFRGIVLHKLMEELVTGEVEESASALEKRAEDLLMSLASEIKSTRPSAAELAETVRRTFVLPEVAAMRPTLVTEWPVYALLKGRAQTTPLAGRLDAASVKNGQVEVVLDWKSDVNPSAAEMARHARQLSDYLAATRAPKGALVYMTTGQIRWVGNP